MFYPLFNKLSILSIDLQFVELLHLSTETFK